MARHGVCLGGALHDSGGLGHARKRLTSAWKTIDLREPPYYDSWRLFVKDWMVVGFIEEKLTPGWPPRTIRKGGSMNRFSLKSMSLVLFLAIFGLLLASCAGAEGPAGPQGPAGPGGAAGPQGPAGPAGAAGGDGADGNDGADGAPGAPGAPGIPGVPGVNGDSSHGNVFLVRVNFAADLSISTTAILTGFSSGADVAVVLKADDGSESTIGMATASAGGIASIDVRHDGLATGTYSVEATGSGGGKASYPIIVK